MSGEWVVLVEATSTSSSGEVDQSTLSRLLRAVEDAEPVALHSVHRYAVQLTVTAENPLDALSSALSRWSEAVDSVGAPTWEVVRTEVMTKAELEHELYLAPATGSVHEAPFNGGGSHGNQRRALAEQLLHNAFHDPVTGLAGEGLLRDHLDRAIADARRNGQRLGVLVVGLHAVRETSKTLGPAFQDAALVVLADRLLQAISPGDVAGRIGDDHFVVLRQNCSERQAVALCEQILGPMQAPITVIDREFEAEVSVGVALSESGEDLLRNAVTALEMTKESPGKEPFAIFPG
jgi:diguanylate cyclase (GGDEF)-like protein